MPAEVGVGVVPGVLVVLEDIQASGLKQSTNVQKTIQGDQEGELERKRATKLHGVIRRACGTVTKQ